MAIILIVEDDVFIREMAEVMISDLGHQFYSAGDSREALLCLCREKQIDALFTDIYLKSAVVGGCELAIEAIKFQPDLHVLYTTGNKVTDAMTRLFVRNSHFITKPYTPNSLHVSIKTMLAA